MTKQKSKKREEKRYSVESGKIIIGVQVRNSRQLFDARDPAPFMERDLDERFAEYILNSAEEISQRIPIKLVVHFSEPEPTPSLSNEEIKEAILSYFRYEAELALRKRNQTFRRGRMSLAFGVVILVGLLTLAEMVLRIPAFPLQAILREGLVISGWVAMWRPIDLLLFDWWPHSAREGLCKKLALTEIEIRRKQ